MISMADMANGIIDIIMKLTVGNAPITPRRQSIIRCNRAMCLHRPSWCTVPRPFGGNRPRFGAHAIMMGGDSFA